MKCIKKQECHCDSRSSYSLPFSPVEKLCDNLKIIFHLFMSAALHKFDIETRLVTGSLHLELKVEMFKVVPRSCGCTIDSARIRS